MNATSAQVDVSAETLVAEFPRVFDGQVKCMPGESFRITLREDSKPSCVSTPRRLPLPYQEKLKEQLEKHLAADMIALVTEPTDWCALIVMAPKKNTDEIRLCVDFTKLNKFVRREIYQSSTPAEAVAEISATEDKFFTTFDALKGYHQCPLDEESQLLTTFITPFGRYKYLRAPYGICSISEHYNRRIDEAMACLTPYSKVVDVCVFDRSFADHVASSCNDAPTEASPLTVTSSGLGRRKFFLLVMFCRHLGTALTPSFFLKSLTSRHRKASLTCDPSWVW